MQPRSASTHSKINCMIRLSSRSISCVWLTARAVRYMICRLLRARASQGLGKPSAEGEKISLPSCWVIERTIRDPSSTWLRETMSILSDKSSEAASPGSVNSISVLPTCTRSPLASSCDSIRWPLTKVPFELARSATVYASPTRRISAWRRETSVSWTWIGFEESRPRPVIPSSNSNLVPWSRPWITNSDGDTILLRWPVGQPEPAGGRSLMPLATPTGRARRLAAVYALRTRGCWACSNNCSILRISGA